MIAGHRLTMNRAMPAAKSAEKSRPLCAASAARQAIESEGGSRRFMTIAASPSNARPPVSQPLAAQLGIQGGLFESWFRIRRAG